MGRKTKNVEAVPARVVLVALALVLFSVIGWVQVTLLANQMDIRDMIEAEAVRGAYERGYRKGKEYAQERCRAG